MTRATICMPCRLAAIAAAVGCAAVLFHALIRRDGVFASMARGQQRRRA